MAQHYKLNYFHTRGQGEPIRFLLSYGQVPFEDNRIEKERWPQLKRQIPFGQLPTLEVEGKEAHQVVAICRYLAKQFGLAGRDDIEAAQIDAVVDTINDLRTKLMSIYLAPDLTSKEKLRQQILDETLPYYLSKFDELIMENNGYLVGGKLSWADLFLISYYENFGVIAQRDVFRDYPYIHLLKENVHGIPAIENWIKTRPFSAF
ncbi:glutathione S-transferase [Anabrus simplex]|uniref:glutathione S-transferase n=1 Tax=Anabrus simplex TaxID=316456 RepID=UPI0035A31D63